MDYSNLKQLASLEETETIVNINYEDKQLTIWTNKATLMRRICKAGYEPTNVGMINGQVYNMEWIMPSSDIGKFMRTGYFKFD